VAMCALFAAGAAGAAPGAYEAPPALSAAQVLPADLAKGPYHAVKGAARNDGLMNHYVLTSAFGEMTADSTDELRIRVGEIRALEAMRKIEDSKTYQDAAAEAGSDAWEGLKSAAADPKGTVEGAAAGLGKLFQGVGAAVSGAPRSEAEESKWKTAIGFASKKREYAADFKVDVYSDNAVLQKRLDEISWNGYVGGLSVGALLALVPGGAGLIVSASQSAELLNDVMRTESPADLRARNQAALVKLGVHPDLAEVFIENPRYTPRQQTIFSAALAQLPGTANPGVIVKLAAGAQDRDIAFFRQRQAQMYSSYHRKVARIARFEQVGRFVVARDAAARLVVCIPADFVPWTAQVDEFLRTVAQHGQALQGVRGKDVWLSGQVSPAARRGLEAQGWMVHDRSWGRLLADAPL